MSHWQTIEERLYTLPSGRGVVFVRCACRRCGAKDPGWLLEAEDGRPLTKDETAGAWRKHKRRGIVGH